MPDIKNAKDIVIRAARAAISYVLSAFGSLFIAGGMYGMLTDSEVSYTTNRFGLDERGVYAVCAIPLLLVFFSYFRAFCISSKWGRERFYERTSGDLFLREKFVYAVKSPMFWIDAAVAAACIILFPIEFGYGNLMSALFYGAELTNGLAKLYCVLIAVPPVTALILAANVAAVTEWCTRRRAEEYGAEAKKYGVSYLVVSIIVPFFIYLFGFGILFTTVFAMFYSLWRVGKGVMLGVLIAAVTVTVLLIGFNYISALRKRRKFIINFRRMCAERGFRLGDIKLPYASVFRTHDGADFTVIADGVSYDCKLMGTARRKCRMLMPECGDAVYRRSVMVFGRELFQTYTVFPHEIDGENKKVLIFIPEPESSYTSAVSHSGGTLIGREIHVSGDRVGDYFIYTGETFINALDRGTLCSEKL